jgi:hypothetical protein
VQVPLLELDPSLSMFLSMFISEFLSESVAELPDGVAGEDQRVTPVGSLTK